MLWMFRAVAEVLTDKRFWDVAVDIGLLLFLWSMYRSTKRQEAQLQRNLDELDNMRRDALRRLVARDED